MNRLLDIQERIRTTTAALGRLEPEFVKNPNSPSLNANIRSLRKLYDNLTMDFEEISGAVGLDVCSYRILDERPSVRTLSKSLGTFQDALATTFQSLMKGPLTKRFLSAETLAQTELSVAYTFPGSFGVVMTVPNERTLFGDDWLGELDRAMDMVFSVARAKTSDSVLELSKSLGKAPIVAVYDWAKANARDMVGTDVQWKRNKSVRNRLLMQYPEFRELTSNIERSSEQRSLETQMEGILVGADILSHRFHFVVDGSDEDIRGRFTDAISDSQTAELPSKYTAHFRKTTQHSLSTDEENIEYFLMRLEAQKH
jgi:hypothetical protein